MLVESLPRSQHIDSPVFPRQFPDQVLSELSKYKDTYHPLSVPVKQKTTNTEGFMRLQAENAWHSSRPILLNAGDILAVVNDDQLATPGENVAFFQVTAQAKKLTPQDAKSEWLKSPFRTESFARKYDYFPYLLRDLSPVSRTDLMAEYFVPPTQELMGLWVQIARSLSERANCYKRKFGAIIVDQGKIVSTGTNYTYTGYEPHECVPCLRENVVSGTHVELCRAIHAEQAAIVNAVNHRVELLFSIMTVAGQEPDGSPFMNPHFYCTVCSRILREVTGLLGVVTDSKAGPVFKATSHIVSDSFQYLEANH